MKKFLITIIFGLLLCSCCCPDDTRTTEYHNPTENNAQTSQKRKSKVTSKYDIPWAKQIGYNPVSGYYITELEVDGHKYVMYQSTIIEVK